MKSLQKESGATRQGRARTNSPFVALQMSFVRIVSKIFGGAVLVFRAAQGVAATSDRQ
jgi:hypothetical protein